MVRTRRAFSWFVALAFIAGAGAAAWYGTTSSGHSAAHPAADSLVIQIPSHDSSEPTGEPDEPSAPAPPRLEGSLPTRLVLASAGIETSINEVGIFETEDGNLEWETAWKSAGHHMDSARPGQPGNMVLTGHVSVADPTNVPVFENLSAVHKGDIVEVFSGGQRFTYQITEIRTVSPNDISVLNGDHRSRLTMITCTTNLEDRLIVVASLI